MDNLNDFNKLYQGIFPEKSDTELFLDSLAKEYHERAEAYDRTVCTGIVYKGSIMPATSHEFTLINKNALKVRRELLELARERHLGSKALDEAIQNYRCLIFKHT